MLPILTELLESSDFTSEVREEILGRLLDNKIESAIEWARERVRDRHLDGELGVFCASSLLRFSDDADLTFLWSVIQIDQLLESS